MTDTERAQAVDDHQLQRHVTLSHDCYLAGDSRAWKREGARKGRTAGGRGGGEGQVVAIIT